MLLCGSYVTLKRVTFIPHCLQNVALCGIECFSNMAQMLLFLFAGLYTIAVVNTVHCTMYSVHSMYSVHYILNTLRVLLIFNIQ